MALLLSASQSFTGLLNSFTDYFSSPLGGKAPGRRPFRPYVEVAATPLGPRLGSVGLTAFHTSVLLDGIEHSFGPEGITTARGPRSHGGLPRENEFRRVPVGRTAQDATHIISLLRPHFAPGSYDMLRKNCNSFTDVALGFLSARRLGDFGQFTRMERLGASADRFGILRIGCTYAPNKAAVGFDREAVLALMGEALKKQRQREHIGRRPNLLMKLGVPGHKQPSKR